MIHSLSGGVIAENGVHTFVKVDVMGTPCWYLSARRLPAGTRVASAASMTSEPSRRISSFSRPQALPYTSLLLSELLHTSSANPLQACAGVKRAGLHSTRRTRMPCAARK